METARQRIFIRADATPRLGTGHVMRCLALAQAAQDREMDVHLICRVKVDWVRQRLLQEKIPHTFIEGDPPSSESPEDVLAQINLATGSLATEARATWVVTDGYHFGPECQKAILCAGYRLLIIDDYAHLPEYHCHILLNQNVDATRLAYGGEIDRKLLGPDYALLRREFRAAREQALAKSLTAPPRTLLISLGGGDFSECLEGVARDMRLPPQERLTLRIIQGAMPAGRIHAAFAGCRARLEIVPQVEDMAALLLDTDICITAGGSTCWELCCLGVPFLTLTIADNQRGITRSLQERAHIAPFTPASLARLLSDPVQRHSQRRTIMNMVSGRGALDLIRIIEETT